MMEEERAEVKIENMIDASLKMKIFFKKYSQDEPNYMNAFKTLCRK